MRSLLIIFLLLLCIVPNEAQKILVNQAGYLPEHHKYVYFTQPADSFYVVDSDNKNVEYKDAVQLGSLNDPATGLLLYYGDFSGLKREGNYRVITNNNDTSYTFSISFNAFKDLFTKSLKAFYFQRCGMELLYPYAGKYNRKACHTADGFLHSSTNLNGFKLATGGWHDAGDFGKYIVNAGITAGTLLLAYELFPSKFNYDNLNIPESGNSIPDILDEVRHELEWFLKMQDTDGGVFFKVTPQNFSGFVMPDQDKSMRYIYEKSTTATGDFAAVLARAARIYSSFDSTFASDCLQASKKAWEYLAANTSIVPPGGFKNPSGTDTGEYGDGNDSDERLWASAELFETTGEDVYHNYYLTHYNEAGLINSTMGWQNVRTLAQLTYLTGSQNKANASLKSNLKNSLINYCSNLVKTSNPDGFHLTIKPGEYYWGSNSQVLNNAVLLIIGYELSANESFYNTALDQLDYIMGCNVHNISFVTGVGTKYPMHPHHRPSAADGINEPVPGLLAGGPNQYLSDPVLQSKFTSSTPPALCYVDDQGSYASNEIAINWNAPLVFVSGYFNENKSTGINKETGQLPEKPELLQNYPNPFNPVTLINYQLSNDGYVTLKVYDVIGNEAKTLVDGYKHHGRYSVSFDADNFSSGVYFYRLKVNNFIETKKMVLLK